MSPAAGGRPGCADASICRLPAASGILLLEPVPGWRCFSSSSPLRRNCDRTRGDKGSCPRCRTRAPPTYHGKRRGSNFVLIWELENTNPILHHLLKTFIVSGCFEDAVSAFNYCITVKGRYLIFGPNSCVHPASQEQIFFPQGLNKAMTCQVFFLVLKKKCKSFKIKSNWRQCAPQ